MEILLELQLKLLLELFVSIDGNTAGAPAETTAGAVCIETTVGVVCIDGITARAPAKTTAGAVCIETTAGFFLTA